MSHTCLSVFALCSSRKQAAPTRCLPCLVTLFAGDLVLTGTPAGVSAIKGGDRVVAQVHSSQFGKLLSEGAWDVV